MKAVLLAALLVACGTPTHEPPAARDPSGPIVARVDGEAIGIEELRAWCAASGLAPREALSRLVEERLLAHYALQHGYGQAPELAHALERASVQSLLAREIEARHPPEDVAARKAALEQLLSELARARGVHYDEPAIRKAFFAETP